MKKVAILTTHRANNFGAMLQAFSLVEMCNELGANAEILDWRCPFYEKLYNRVFKFKFGARLLWYMFWKLAIERPTWSRFNDFRLGLRLSKPIYDKDQLPKAEAAYDVFITGSDQVWNPVNSAPALRPELFDRTYLLDFVKSKSKNSYAASIGVEEIRPIEILDEFIAAWKTFDVISVREHRGAEYVERLSGHIATPVVDPVLLHDADWWIRKTNTINLDGLGGVFLYNVNQIQELNHFAKLKAGELKKKLIKPIIPAQAMFLNVFGKAFGPLEFVKAIRESTCVCTSSFHCAAFSLIFRKRLFLARRTTSDRPNSRYEALFKFASVVPDVIYKEPGLEIVEVDFAKIDETIFNNERIRSLSVLKKIIS